MSRKSLSFTTLIAASVATLAAFVPAPAASAPIRISHCFIISPRPLSTKARGTQIDYENVGSKTAKSVTFAVGYRNAQHHLLRRVTDEGNFAPGAKIQHSFSLFSDVTYAGKQTQGCEPIAVSFSDGTRWSAVH